MSSDDPGTSPTLHLDSLRALGGNPLEVTDRVAGDPDPARAEAQRTLVGFGGATALS